MTRIHQPLLSLFQLATLFSSCCSFVVSPPTRISSRFALFSSKQQEQDVSAKQALERTAAHLRKLQALQEPPQSSPKDPFAVERELLYRQYLKQSANSLKLLLKKRGLMQNGRKPTLAARLAEYELQTTYGIQTTDFDDGLEKIEKWNQHLDKQEHNEKEEDSIQERVTTFCGLQLSDAASKALTTAQFYTPSSIQAKAFPSLYYGKESAILHAATGSGKSLAYLLPFTERLWNTPLDDVGYGVILTPTRELAAQVAGIATVLSPPGTVRLVSRATNLMSSGIKEKGEGEFGGRIEDDSCRNEKLFVGSAKSIFHSLYGDGVMPASPTTKPEAQYFLKHVQYLVLDEVDRLLNVKKTRKNPSKGKIHEKPAAILVAAITRSTLGRAQIVAASATVGRPLKREVARVLGLPPQGCPQVIVGDESSSNESNNERESTFQRSKKKKSTTSRAVTVPSTVKNYVVAVDGSSTGKLLTSAFFCIKQLSNKPRKILLVLTRGCGISTQHAVGALKHFGCKPTSLLDALEASGTDDMIQVHRDVSGASGVGEKSNSYFSSNQQGNDKEHEKREEGYLLVTGEDSVRGLHLDGLDVVIVVGRPHGPDEYTHIAGRTGRAGLPGSVVNVVSTENAAALKSWEQMLSLGFEPLKAEDIPNL